MCRAYINVGKWAFGFRVVQKSFSTRDHWERTSSKTEKGTGLPRDDFEQLPYTLQLGGPTWLHSSSTIPMTIVAGLITIRERLPCRVLRAPHFEKLQNHALTGPKG